MIEARALCLRLGNKPLLEDLSLSLPRGQFTAVIGPNGAGKSTLLSLLGRLQRPSGGQVLFDGVPLAEHIPHELARRLSILRQTNEITPRLTIAELVAFGRFPHNPGQLTAADHAIIDAAISRLALEKIRHQRLDTLSGGQKQRALIAMCLAQTPEVLLLDEPLNNLDLPHARRVIALCQEEAAKGKTVVAVLHDLTTAATFANHFIALRNGRVHSIGTAGEVMTEANLSDLYQTDIEVAEINGRRIVLTV